MQKVPLTIYTYQELIPLILIAIQSIEAVYFGQPPQLVPIEAEISEDEAESEIEESHHDSENYDKSDETDPARGRRK